MLQNETFLSVFEDLNENRYRNISRCNDDIFFIVSKMVFFAAIEFYTKRDADALEILSGSALIVLPLVRKSRIEVGEHTVTTV